MMNSGFPASHKLVHSLVQEAERLERVEERVALRSLVVCGTMTDGGREGKGRRAGRAVGMARACGGGERCCVWR